MRASFWRILVSTGGRVPTNRQAWWPQWSLSLDPSYAHPTSVRQAHRWLGGGRGCPRPLKELADTLRSVARFPSPCFFHPNRPCFRLEVGGLEQGLPSWETRRGAFFFPTHP